MPPGRRGRGRPPIDVTDPTTVPVHVRLPTRAYDQVYREAVARRQNVPEFVRSVLAVYMQRDRPRDRGSK